MNQGKDKIHVLIKQEFVWHYSKQQKAMGSKLDEAQFALIQK
jgi:hypothetical protein